VKCKVALYFASIMFLTVFLASCGKYNPTGSNPSPTVSSLSPSSALAGGPALTLTVNGTGFVTGSTVQFKGSNRGTTFVTATQLTATLTAADILTAGTAAVSAVNPTPGGGTSPAATFTISSSLVSIAVNPAHVSISRRTTQQFTAIGTFADGSTQDVTGSVDWSSSLPGVASISPGGLATGVSAGNAGIIAASGAVSGSTSLTVTVTLASPRFAYVSNFIDFTVSIYTVNAISGQMRTNGYVQAGAAEPVSVAVDPLGKFAYVVNLGSDNISAFSVNPNTGALTAVCPAVPTGDGPRSMAVDPSGKFAYSANEFSNSVSAFAINASTGALTVAGPDVAAGTNPFSITVDPSGKFVYVVNHTSDNVSAYTINANTGALTAMGSPVAAGSGPVSVTVEPSGQFAYVSAFAINGNSGALTAVGPPVSVGTNPFSIQPRQRHPAAVGTPVAAGATPTSVAVEPTGKFVYLTNHNSNSVSVFAIDPGTGALTAVGSPVATVTGPVSVTVDFLGRFAFVASDISNNVSVFAISGNTWALTAVGSPVASATGPASVTTTGKIQ